MILLFDIGNTNTHVGLANSRRVLRKMDLPTNELGRKSSGRKLLAFVGNREISGAALCSVVPVATVRAIQLIWSLFRTRCIEVAPGAVGGLCVKYPKPQTIGPDRLANAVAARHHYGSPSVVIDFGTATTLDVVDSRGNYVGGIIAPGIASMTEYLHERTALLPLVKIRPQRRAIGRSTEEAILAGVVHGYRGLVRELLHKVSKELKIRSVPVIATGGYARLMAAQIPEITAVQPLLTLEGVRLVWEGQQAQNR